MAFMTVTFLGVRGWIWLYFFFSILAFCGAVIYWYREEIKKKYYQFRFPEKLLRVLVHYKSGSFREYWRIIPDNESFILEGKTYKYSDKTIVKPENMFLLQSNKNILELDIDGKKYSFDKHFCIHKRKSAFPEIHYYFNNPNPLNFEVEKDKSTLSAYQETEFQNNNLVSQLLTMDTQKSLMNLILMICGINAIGLLFLIAKTMGWIQ